MGGGGHTHTSYVFVGSRETLMSYLYLYHSAAEFCFLTDQKVSVNYLYQ